MTVVSIFLDLALIGLLIAGIRYAVKLTRQLSEMRAGRAEMERFVLEFNATVGRAEAGIRGLKVAARESGDDLEKLIEKAHALRDELHFLIESADQIATRLSNTAAVVTRASAPPESAPKTAPKTAPSNPAKSAAVEPAAAPETGASAAERDLMRALGKLR